MATRDGAKFLGLNDAGQRHKGFQVVLMRAPRLDAVQVSKPLGLLGNVCARLKFGKSYSFFLA